VPKRVCGRELAKHVAQQRKAPAEGGAVAAVKLYFILELVDLNTETVEFDVVLPIVAEGHALGALRMAGLDELEERTQSLDGRGAVRHQVSRLQASLRCEATLVAQWNCFCAPASNLCSCYRGSVLSMPLRVNQRSRLVGEVYPERRACPDWPQDAAIRHELEKLYTEWGLDIRWLRGERPHRVVIADPPSPSKRRSRAKSHRVS
jgi:hypothetical protein